MDIHEFYYQATQILREINFFFKNDFISRVYFIIFSALDTINVQVKKQVFELLSALCVYSSEGYSRALEALEHYKTFRSERYRFKLVVDELRDAKSNEYKTVLLAFINCLIISTPQLKVSNTLNSILCLTTVWKFSNFPATMILRKINFG